MLAKTIIGGYEAGCANCEVATAVYPTEQEAAEAWNRRTETKDNTSSQTTLDEVIKERMREALEKWEQETLERMRARMAEDKPYYYLGRFDLNDEETEE